MTTICRRCLPRAWVGSSLDWSSVVVKCEVCGKRVAFKNAVKVYSPVSEIKFALWQQMYEHGPME